MKKIFTIVLLSMMIWSCAKKMAPEKSSIPGSNTGSVGSSNSETPTSVANNTQSANSSALFTTNEVSGTKTVVKEGTNSPEVMSQIEGQSTFNTKCGRCHQLKVTTNYTADRWASIMAVMANPTHANLSDTERQNVLAYVQANAKQ